jgi:hypothetical protein
MATIRSGLFTLEEFSYRRNVLKLAPDAFVLINGALGSRVLSPLETNRTQDIEIRGGITSISVSCAISPPGSSKANIEIIAPLYKGLHEDYYITLPNGVRVPFFVPMMEVKIYMKGRFIEQKYNNSPRYYPVFWGMITSIQENYSDGNVVLSLSCEDFLSWWKFQKITINPSAVESFFGGAIPSRFPSVFEKMSAWEIIYALFTDAFFIQHRDNGAEAYFNFVYPKWSKTGIIPDSLLPIRDTFGPLSTLAIKYWNERFGLGVTEKYDPEIISNQLEKIPLRMYGLRGPIKFEVIRNKLLSFLDKKEGLYGEQADRRADLDLDFGLLARVQPYGLFDLFGNGAESTIFSKLEIASAICEKVFMEFFVDTNGEIVFKPPFYNLDISKIKYYRIGPEDIINFNTSFDSNEIVNYLVVTGPIYQTLDSLEAIGFHADFDSIKKYGIRSEQVHVPYGMNAKQLKMIAVAEMTRRNGQAYTGSVSIPLRPEIRLGYPIYIEHIDTYYYITGLNHNITFGSSAATEISFQFRRERVFDDGNSGLPDSELGDVLYACVLRNKETEIAELIKTQESYVKDIEQKISILTEASPQLKSGELVSEDWTYKDVDRRINEYKKQLIAVQSGVYEGYGLLGLWKIDRAKINQKVYEQIINSNEESAYISNELVMITDTSVPFTDKLGYRHIGAFSYGANLMLVENGEVKDMTNFIEVKEAETKIILNSSGIPEEFDTSTVYDMYTSDVNIANEADQKNTEEFLKVLEKRRNSLEDTKQQQNLQSVPMLFEDKTKEGYKNIINVENAAMIYSRMAFNIADPCTKESNQNESSYSG